VRVAAATLAALLLARAARAAEDACSEAADPAAAGDCLPPPPVAGKMVPDLNVLKTPVSPAVAAIGVAPVDIQRPSTPTGAAVGLASGIVRGLLVPGTSTSVDVAPYWLWQHASLTAAKVEAQPWLAFLRDLSLSAATAPGKETRTASDGSETTIDVGRLGLGVRTTLWPGMPSRAALHCMDVIDRYMHDDVLDRARNDQEFERQYRQLHPPPQIQRIAFDPKTMTPDEFTQKLEALNAEQIPASNRWIAGYNAAYVAWKAERQEGHAPSREVVECAPVVHHREGPLAAAAASVAWSAPGGNFQQLSAGGRRDVTLWVTAGWTASFGGLGRVGAAQDLSLFGAVRQRWQTLFGAKDVNGTDYGARAVYAWARLGLSVQAIHAGPGFAQPTAPAAWTGGAAIDYHLVSGYWLTLAAASDDLGKINSWSTARALVQIQYNVGRERLIERDGGATQEQRPAGNGS
jgi:hypothetical protein